MIRHEAVAWSNEKDCSGKIAGGGEKEFFTIWGMKRAKQFPEETSEAS